MTMQRAMIIVAMLLAVSLCLAEIVRRTNTAAEPASAPAVVPQPPETLVLTVLTSHDVGNWMGNDLAQPQ